MKKKKKNIYIELKTKKLSRIIFADNECLSNGKRTIKCKRMKDTTTRATEIVEEIKQEKRYHCQESPLW